MNVIVKLRMTAMIAALAPTLVPITAMGAPDVAAAASAYQKAQAAELGKKHVRAAPQ